jgi:hypothetical protein
MASRNAVDTLRDSTDREYPHRGLGDLDIAGSKGCLHLVDDDSNPDDSGDGLFSSVLEESPRDASPKRQHTVAVLASEILEAGMDATDQADGGQLFDNDRLRQRDLSGALGLFARRSDGCHEDRPLMEGGSRSLAR